ncbi:hypothetical protein FOCC_FOCC015306 [Frankliniella occidentalis]|nr:hypothetical protein FOCC_FOCC015306 [Frankliniella occidentalis]
MWPTRRKDHCHILNVSQLVGQSTSTFRKRKAHKLMRQGEVEAPHLDSKTVLRKAKQNIMDQNLKITSSSSEPIINLGSMKKQEPYSGSIHQIGMDPFFVHYHSHAQLHVFKKFVHSSHTVLALDATGSVVRRLRLLSGGRSPHIFLYEGVIKAGHEQLSVCQMLSARQDANIIKFWLDELLRQGAPIPDEVVTDNSKAKQDMLKPHIEGNKTENNFLKTCQSLALVGAVSETYMLRVETLTEITPMCPVVEPPLKKGSRKKT